jgi:hypothetical protein
MGFAFREHGIFYNLQQLPTSSLSGRSRHQTRLWAVPIDRAASDARLTILMQTGSTINSEVGCEEFWSPGPVAASLRAVDRG